MNSILAAHMQADVANQKYLLASAVFQPYVFSMLCSNQLKKCSCSFAPVHIILNRCPKMPVSSMINRNGNLWNFKSNGRICFFSYQLQHRLFTFLILKRFFYNYRGNAGVSLWL